MPTVTLSDVAIILGPGVALAWKFLVAPVAPYRRAIKQFEAAQNTARVLLSLGRRFEARLLVRRAEGRILGRVEFDRSIQLHQRTVHLVLWAWSLLWAALIIRVVSRLAQWPWSWLDWLAVALATVGGVLGLFATRDISGFVAGCKTESAPGLRGALPFAPTPRRLTSQAPTGERLHHQPAPEIPGDARDDGVRRTPESLGRRQRLLVARTRVTR